MITDVFHVRNSQEWPFERNDVSVLLRLLMQASLILKDDIAPVVPDDDAVFERAIKQLDRELGSTENIRKKDAKNECLSSIQGSYEPSYKGHQPVEEFFKVRISLIELLFRGFMEFVQAEKKLDELDKNSRKALSELIRFGNPKASTTEQIVDQ